MTSNQPLETAPVPPWWRRVVPLVGVVLVVVALGVALVPSLREQMLLSASHREASYVEMAFTPDEQGLVQPCVRSKAGIEVRFSMAGHGDDVGRRSWRILLTHPKGTRTGHTVLTGTTRLPEDGPASVTRLVESWSGPYRLEVILPGTRQRLVAHCGVAR